MTDQNNWIDISVALRSGMLHWPDDPPVRIDRIQDMGKGDTHNLSEMALGSHSGTHIDAPLHFFKRGLGIDLMPLDVTNGRVRVIGMETVDFIDTGDLEPYHPKKGERILLKTRNSATVWKDNHFIEDYVYLTENAANFLAKAGVILVGIDYLSIGGYHRNNSETHRALLQAGVWIIEGLDLSLVSPGEYELVCLPLKIGDGEGAPARAVLRTL